MLTLVGLSHQTAPLDVRERVAFSDPDLPEALEALRAIPGAREALLLSTCNRTEVYLVTSDGSPQSAVAGVLADARGTPAAGFRAYLRTLRGEDAARHALRVAAGLESMIVGESQILGQVRRAFAAAREGGTTGPVLNRLMQVAIACGRRVRAQTALGRRAASVPHAALAAAGQALGGVAGRGLVIVGAGEMAELTAKVFTHAGVRLIGVANRTDAAARALAARYAADGTGLEQLAALLDAADIVVVSVGAEPPVLTPSVVDGGRGRRRPMMVIDLGVPRGVAAEVRRLPHVTLCDLDALVPAGGEAPPGEDLARAGEIVDDALDVFARWLGARAAVPVIAALHRRAERIIEEELHRADPRLRGLDDRQRRVVRGVVEGALRKLLHGPFVRLRARGEDERAMALARDLFDLDGDVQEEEGA